jgi:hypothetical protein
LAQLSKITINLNNSIAIQSTIISLECESFTDFEFIVIDDDSLSYSFEIIKNTQKRMIF